MRKFMIVALIAAAFAVMVPAHAAGGSNCVVPGQGLTPEQSCSYVATGPGSFTQATPNGWDISVVRNAVKVVLASSGTLGTPSNGSFASLAGETVTVTLHRDCIPTGQCGNLGFIAAGDN